MENGPKIAILVSIFMVVMLSFLLALFAPGKKPGGKRKERKVLWITKHKEGEN